MPTTLSRPDKHASVMQAMDRICNSAAFRSSKRAQAFLRHILEASLLERMDELKERAIAVAVFGRKPDYSAAEDSIVRVQARDVRQRLARFYAEEGQAETIRFDLPLGTYRLSVHSEDLAAGSSAVASPPANAETAPEREKAAEGRPSEAAGTALPASARLYQWAALSLVLILGLGLGLYLLKSPPKDVGEEAYSSFWAPALESEGSPIIASGRGRHWILSPRLESEVQAPGRFPKQINIAENDIQALDSGQISLENALAAANLTLTLSRPKHQAELRIFDQIRTAEFKDRPLVMLGAFNNGMAMNAMQKLRYRFENRNNEMGIFDSTDSQQGWRYSRRKQLDFVSSEDYAMICRFRESGGAPSYLIAGIYGPATLAASEFASQPRYWAAVAKRAPAGWQDMNLQIVLRTVVSEKTAHPPEIVAVHFWR